MKIFVVIALLFFQVNLFGQIYAEINAGINYSNAFQRFSPLNIYDLDSDFDWKVGLGLGIKVKNKWILKSGIYASLRTSKGAILFGPPGFKVRSTFSFFEIPVIYYRNFLHKNLYLGGGFVNCFQVAPATHLIDEKTFQIDLSLNAKYYLTNRLNVELSYQLGDVFSLFNTEKSRYLFSTGNLSINFAFISIKNKITN
ncbi:MAG: hypothetical protein IPM34_08375 [Saprospiraceae bacterium]|nr:hypothetical protein [Saprospiraceae bacterium]